MIESENEPPSVRNNAMGYDLVRLRKRIHGIVFNKGVSDIELFGTGHKSHRSISPSPTFISRWGYRCSGWVRNPEPSANSRQYQGIDSDLLTLNLIISP